MHSEKELRQLNRDRIKKRKISRMNRELKGYKIGLNHFVSDIRVMLFTDSIEIMEDSFSKFAIIEHIIYSNGDYNFDLNFYEYKIKTVK